MRTKSTNVTGRPTDRQADDMRSQDRALHYSALRGKNNYTTLTSNDSDNTVS